MEPTALAEVIEVELEDIVALDHVRIDLAERGGEFNQQLFFSRVRHLIEQQQPILTSATQPDCQHAVTRSRRIGKATVRRRCFDIELTPAQLRETKIAVQALAVLQQKLAFERSDHVPADRRRLHRLGKDLKRSETLRMHKSVKRPRSLQLLQRQSHEIYVRRSIVEPPEGTKRLAPLLTPTFGRDHRRKHAAVLVHPHAAKRTNHTQRAPLRTVSGRPL